MKFIQRADDFFINRRSPCGERGLKYKPKVAQFNFYGSLPVRGAWIEIAQPEIYTACLSSLPVRGAWIEMTADAHGTPITLVAPRAGSVD